MKIGIFLQHYFPYGGLQRDSVRFAHAATKMGHEPTLVISSSHGPLPEGFPVEVLGSGGVSNHSKLLRFSRDCRQLGHFDTSIAFSRIAETPFHFCGDPCFREKFIRTKTPWMRLLPRYQFFLNNEKAIFGANSSTHVFFLAESEIPPFKEHYNMNSDRFSVLPPWLAPPTTCSDARSSVREQLGIPQNSALLLFVGSDFQRKGLDRAIAALPLLKHVHLVICGQDELDKPQNQTNKLGLQSRVHILGPRDDIPRMILASDILIHPARQETAGMVLLEALSHGVPVLCTSHCGYAKHVKTAGCPLLSNQPTPEEIAKTVQIILDERESLGLQIEEWAKKTRAPNAAEIMIQTMERTTS